MTISIAILALAAGLSVAMTGAWLVAISTGRSGWIDAIWSLATGICGATAALSLPAGAEPSARQMLVAAMALIWSLRLGLHIARRSASHGEDPRYKYLLATWGEDFKARLFQFLQIQALAAFVLVLSIMLAAHRPEDGLTVADGLGALLFIVAVIGEGVADNQLSRFRSDPANAGRICDAGLWARSRHPNYFFEWLVWLSYPLIALDFSGGYPWGWLSLTARSEEHTSAPVTD